MPNRCVAAGCGNMPSDSCLTFPFSERSTFVRCLDQTSSTNAGELEAFFCVGSMQRTFQCQLLRRHSSVESKFSVCCTT